MKMDDQVLTFRLRPSELGKWMHQNRAEYTGDSVEGCLLDSFVLTCKCMSTHSPNGPATTW